MWSSVNVYSARKGAFCFVVSQSVRTVRLGVHIIRDALYGVTAPHLPNLPVFLCVNRVPVS